MQIAPTLYDWLTFNDESRCNDVTDLDPLIVFIDSGPVIPETIPEEIEGAWGSDLDPVGATVDLVALQQEEKDEENEMIQLFQFLDTVKFNPYPSKHSKF